MLHSWSVLSSEQGAASRRELTVAVLAARHRPAPASVNLTRPPVSASPLFTCSYTMWPSEFPTLAGLRVWACTLVKLRLAPYPGISIPQP